MPGALTDLYGNSALTDLYRNSAAAMDTSLPNPAAALIGSPGHTHTPPQNPTAALISCKKTSLV